MKKTKKIILVIKKEFLNIKYIVSEKWYRKSSIKYMRYMGINLIGEPKFVARDVKFDLTDPSKISIGNGTVITSKCTILVHDYSIECGLVAIGKEDKMYEAYQIKEVKIGNNCFIGQNSFIKPGTIIEDNCIVGAGSVVSGNIPKNSIVIGNPAKVIKNTLDWANKKFIEHSYLLGNRRLNEKKNS